MNAERIATSYRWLEYAAFGFALEHARFDFLSHARDARRVLILGEGDGRFLARLVECNRHARVAVVESSARMIQLARRRVPVSAAPRVEFHQMDVAAQPLPAGPFDLAVTHFFLDILTPGDAEALICKVSALLSPRANWMVSEFQEPCGQVRGLHARLWLAAMYGFFRVSAGLGVSKLPPYRDLLRRYGLTEIEHRERRLGLIRSQVWRKQL
ncbi:MAG: class I SAM-dependent methyltransferase [Bryobacteraceae bacterium]